MSLVESKYVESVQNKYMSLLPYFGDLLPKEIAAIIISYLQELISDHFHDVFCVMSTSTRRWIWNIHPNECIYLKWQYVSCRTISMEGLSDNCLIDEDKLMQQFNERNLEKTLTALVMYDNPQTNAERCQKLAQQMYAKYELVAQQLARLFMV
jgi:hypothetical protein